ncbi:MAG TPA: TIGR02301 family protein, partial [Xanthobacteraceae bacterium]|nr:TIGR02301 family protein [Xanthobacteraceae bacterium]
MFASKPILIAFTALLVLAAPTAISRAEENPAPPAPYQGELERLAEILGALHHLRSICGANEGQTWRNEMQALIEAETPNGERRNQLVASFNRGYRGFQQSYHTCTRA